MFCNVLEANFSICCSTKVVVLNSLGRIVSFSTGSVTVLSCAVISSTTSLAVSVKGSLVALDTFSVFTRDSVYFIWRDKGTVYVYVFIENIHIHN